MMERRMKRKFHVRCEAGENLEITSKSYLSLYWAIRHLEYFPVEINRADYDTLLRVPGIGYKSASRIVKARRHSTLNFADLKKIGVVLKRALYFITCSGRMMYRTKLEEDYICRNLMGDKTQIPREIRESGYQQLSLFDTGLSTELLPLS